MSSPYNKETARKAAFHAVFLRLPAQAATVLSYVLLVRLLSETDFGIYSLFYAILPLASTLASLGLEHTLRRYQPEYLKQGENRLAHRLVRRVAQIRLLANVTVIALMLIFWSKLAPLLKITEYLTYFLLFAFVIITDFQCRILTIALSSKLMHKYSMGMLATFSIGKLLGYAATAVLVGFSLWKALVVDLSVFLVYYAGLKYFYETRPDHASGKTSMFSRKDKRRMFKYGAVYNFSDTGGAALNTRTDNLFIAAMMDPIAVGAYSFCTGLSHMVQRASPLRLLETVIQPMFFSLNYRRNPKRVQDYFSLLLTLSFVVKLPAFVFVMFYHREVVQVVFGGKFLEYSYLLIGVFSFSVLSSIATPVTLVAQLQEKAHVILASRVFGVYNIVANLVLIPRMGIAGAVVATGTATLMKNLFIWWCVRDLARWKQAPRFVLHSAAVWGAFALTVTQLAPLIGDAPLQQLLIGLALWCAFGALYLRTGVLSPEQRQMIARLFTGREGKVLRLLGLAA